MFSNDIRLAELLPGFNRVEFDKLRCINVGSQVISRIANARGAKENWHHGFE